MTHPNPKFEGLDPTTRALFEVINQILNPPERTPLKSLLGLAKDLREHAYKYAFDDGALCRDLYQAANYLEAMANG